MRCAPLLPGLLAVAVVLAGCGTRAASPGPSPGVVEAAPSARAPSLAIAAAELPPRIVPPRLERCHAGELQRMRTRTEAYAALAKGPVEVFARPGGSRIRAFDAVNVNGYPTVLGVLAAVLDEDCQPAWYRVQLPVRPNGSVGFVRAGEVDLAAVDVRIEIDLSQRRIDFYRAGKRVLRTTAAVGAPITPTPTGRYYVNQKLVAPDPWGPFGPAALGISAFSPVLQDWVQGGPIAIHGTNEPSSVGKAVSHGCLRVPNETLTWLFEHTPPGTPVVISA